MSPAEWGKVAEQASSHRDKAFLQSCAGRARSGQKDPKSRRWERSCRSLNSKEESRGGASAAWESLLLRNFSSLNNSKAPHPIAAIVVREGIPTRTMISTTFFRWKKKTGNAAQQKYHFHSSSSTSTSLLPTGSRLTCLESAVQHGCIFRCKDPKAVMWWKPPRLELAMGGSSLCTLERAAH